MLHAASLYMSHPTQDSLCVLAMAATRTQDGALKSMSDLVAFGCNIEWYAMGFGSNGHLIGAKLIDDAAILNHTFCAYQHQVDPTQTTMLTLR